MHTWNRGRLVQAKFWKILGLGQNLAAKSGQIKSESERKKEEKKNIYIYLYVALWDTAFT